MTHFADDDVVTANVGIDGGSACGLKSLIDYYNYHKMTHEYLKQAVTFEK